MFDFLKRKKEAPAEERCERAPLSFRLGFSEGKDLFCDLAKMPHLLVAGDKGEKAGWINTVLVSLAVDNPSEAVQLVLMDSTEGALEQFSALPHLMVPLICEAKKAINSLNWIVIEMQRRYEIIQAAGVRDITEYNRTLPFDPLPRLVVVVNELAELMSFDRDGTETALCRLAQMGRGAGIHLILATSHPAPFVVTGILKANLPSRIAFALKNEDESRAVLDTAGAEALSEGEMLYLPVGASKPIRVITCPTTDEDVKGALELMSYRKKKEEAKPSVDPLRDQAILLALEHGQLTTSLLQRKLNIGYARAARLVDLLEEMKVVGPYCGAKPRDVLWNETRYQELKDTDRGEEDSHQRIIPRAALQALCEDFEGECSLYVSIPETGEKFLYREHERINAASTVKIPLLALLLKDAEEGRLELYAPQPMKAENFVRGSGVLKYLSPTLALSLYDYAVMMIVLSDNSATNQVIDAVGMDRANAFFRESGWMETELNRKLFAPNAGDTALGNYSSAADLGNMLEGILAGELVSPEASEIMKRIMACQTLGKFSKSLPAVHRPQNTLEPLALPPEGKVILVEKGGTLTGQVSHDAAIMILPDGRSAVLVMMTECESGDASLDAIQKVSRMIYDRMITH